MFPVFEFVRNLYFTYYRGYEIGKMDPPFFKSFKVLSAFSFLVFFLHSLLCHWISLCPLCSMFTALVKFWTDFYMLNSMFCSWFSSHLPSQCYLIFYHSLLETLPLPHFQESNGLSFLLAALLPAYSYLPVSLIPYHRRSLRISLSILTCMANLFDSCHIAH